MQIRTPQAVTPAPAVVGPTTGSDPRGHLATGWEPHRELDDGLVRRFVFAHASSLAGPAARVGGHVVRRDAYVVWDRGRPAGFFNGACLLQPLPYEAWEEVLDGLECDLVAGGTGDVALFSPWPTPDLSVRGWRLAGHPPLLVRLRGGAATEPPAWLRVEKVGDAAALADWERVAVEGYPLDGCRPLGPGALLDERVLADEAFHAWVGYADGQPVSIGTSYVAHGVDVFALGVTLPAFRGRGAWHAHARRRLASFPELPAMALCSDDSRAPAEGLGFVALARWTVWLRDRPA